MRVTRPPILALGALTVLAGLIAGCAPAGAGAETIVPANAAVDSDLSVTPDIPVIEDLVYGEADGDPLLLDACLPPQPADGAPETDARPAIVSIHGGYWTRGSKSSIAWRAVCQWLASAGYPTFSIDYRLAPASVFPAAIEDAQAAVRWLRQPAQVESFGIDPDRIGAFGGSAGGNLAALLGTRGSGSLTTGSRVAAVVELSGPTDLTGIAVNDDFVPYQLSYLGCDAQDDCPAAALASPITHVDPSDPPFFVGHSTDELIPLGQGRLLVRALRGADVPTTFVSLRGTLHSIAMLDEDVKDRIVRFYRATLGVPVDDVL